MDWYNKTTTLNKKMIANKKLLQNYTFAVATVMTFGVKGFKVIWLVSILWMVNKKFDETNLKPK